MDRLSLVDWSVVGIYLLGIAALAFLVAGRQRSTRDYFLGGRSLPWWAAGLSIIATETSAVTFIGVPLAAYKGDWGLLQLVAGFVIGRVLLSWFFVRAFFRREFETVYGFLGERFGASIQRLAALLFLAGRIVASGVRLYAGCLAVRVAAGLAEEETVLAIVALGVLGTAMTFTGGVRAVVWTDVVLGITFAAAAGGCVLLLFATLPEGAAAISSPALSEKLRVVDWSWSLGSSTNVFAGLIGGTFVTLASHGTDQDIAQRMLTCRDAASGRRSVLASAVLIVPLFMLFLAFGTLLYLHDAPSATAADVPPATNELVPRFIVAGLPTGVRGFVTAGLLAASLSSLTSVLNALAATVISDLYRPLLGRGAAPDAVTARRELLASRLMTILWGVFLTLTAIGFVGGSENILTVALRALTYFYGGILGAFLLGIFSNRGSPRSVGLGMLAGVVVVVHLQLREFLDSPASTPDAIRAGLERLPRFYADAIIAYVPAIAWTYWIVIGTAVSVAVGALAAGKTPSAEIATPPRARVDA